MLIFKSQNTNRLREALFIKRNKERWLQHEKMPPDTPDEMAAAFTQMVDDLGYAKTFYPESSTTQYLNRQSAKIYLNIYKNKREGSNRLLDFWKYDLPLTLYKYRKATLFSLLFFILFFLLGYLVAGTDSSMARNFFGDEYVNETLNNIKEGNPFGIYENGNPVLMWLGIMINNIKVAFIFFVSGIFAGIPTMYKMAESGAMLGIFDQMFAAHGLGVQFWLVVFVHGTLEITGIILAGAAGYILGMGYIFPGTLSRVESFKRSAKDGVKILIGLLPVFAVAAFFEGLITRLYNDITLLTTAVTTLSVFFVIWYFIIYPAKLGRKVKTTEVQA